MKVTRVQFAFAAVAFVGALLVAQPGGAAFSWFYLLGIWNAGARRGANWSDARCPRNFRGGGGAWGDTGHLCRRGRWRCCCFEDFVKFPTSTNWRWSAAAAFVLMIGHIFIFMAYRTADPGAVSPFVYTGTLWAVIASVTVFGYVPTRWPSPAWC